MVKQTFQIHGANRLGASALMQGLSDGYFVLPYTIADYLADVGFGSIDENSDEVKSAIEAVDFRTNQLLNIQGDRSARSFHKQLGKIMWDHAGWQETKKVLKMLLLIFRILMKSSTKICLCSVIAIILILN